MILSLLILPASGLETALDVDETAFMQIMGTIFGSFGKTHNPEPFGPLLTYAVSVCEISSVATEKVTMGLPV